MNASKLFKLVGLSVLLAAATAAWAADPATKPDGKELDSLRAADFDWEKAYNGGDAAKVTALYAGDAVLMPPGAPAARGKRAIEKFFLGDIAASQKAGVQFHIGNGADAGIQGDWGWVAGTYTVTDKTGKTVDAGKYLSVSHKVKGNWYYVRDTWNSDH